MELELVENKKVDQKSPEKKVVKKRNKFHISAKSFFLTYPQCDLNRQDAYDQLSGKIEGISYVHIAKELHESGDPHLHILLITKEKKNIYNEKYFDIGGFHGNYQSAKSTDNVLDYIKKADEHPLIVGEYKSNSQTAVQRRALENKVILEKSMPELVKEGIISMHNYSLIRNAKILHTLDSTAVPTYQPKTCYWIFGGTGIGKSRWVRDNCESFYNKPMNKWWDGYSGESCVLIDDFDMGGSVLGHYLKIWADCYSFNAEVKGSTIKPVINMFVVTSQYLPSEIFKQTDWEMVKAIERRFQIKTIANGNELIDHE